MNFIFVIVLAIPHILTGSLKPVCRTIKTAVCSYQETFKLLIKPAIHSKGNSAGSHMCILLISHYSLILRNKKHCRKFKYNNIDYNLKKLFQYLASNNQYLCFSV